MGKGRKKGNKKIKKIKGRKGKKKQKRGGGRSMRGGEKRKKEKGSDSWCSDGRKLLVRELKLVYAIRVTCGYRNLNFSSKFQKVGVSPTLVISCLVAM